MTAAGAGTSTSHSALTKVIGTNTVSGIAASATQVLTRLVTIPIVIAHLGLGGYGIWAIIMTAAAYMRFGSVGIKSAFQKYVAEATGNKDYNRASQLLSTGCALMLALSLVGVFPVVMFSRQIVNAVGVPLEFQAATAGAVSVLALIMVISNAGSAFEAIVLGGHRIDLARGLTMVFTVAEAIAIALLLHCGYGLLAMAWVMAVSEVGFVISCYVVSRKVVPEIRVQAMHFRKSVLGELFRYAGSYQLVNILEVLYGAILPFVILRAFGANAAGTYAIVSRLVASAMILQNAFLLPVLSGGTMVYASGSIDTMRTLLIKSFKITLGLTLFPLGFISIFGMSLVYAWTGQEQAYMGPALRLICLGALFNGLSTVQLVLYRVSGLAMMDNVRQVLRILILASIAALAPRLGFTGVLWGVAIAELAGVVFMMFALTRTFRSFDAKALIPDAARLILASALVIACGAIAARIPLPGIANARWSATLELCEASIACLLVIWPALLLTRAMTGSERRAILSVLLPNRFAGGSILASPTNE